MKNILLLICFLPFHLLSQTQVSEFTGMQTAIESSNKKFIYTDEERFFIQYDERGVQTTLIHEDSLEYLYFQDFDSSFNEVEYLGFYDDLIYFSGDYPGIQQVNIETGEKDIYLFDHPNISEFEDLYAQGDFLYFKSGDENQRYYSYNKTEDIIIDLISADGQYRLDSMLYSSSSEFNIYNLINNGTTIVDSVFSNLSINFQRINNDNELVAYDPGYWVIPNIPKASVVHINSNHEINFGKQCEDSNSLIYNYKRFNVIDSSNFASYSGSFYVNNTSQHYSSIDKYSNSCGLQGTMTVESGPEWEVPFSISYSDIYQSDKSYMFVESTKGGSFDPPETTHSIVNLTDLSKTIIQGLTSIVHTWNNNHLICFKSGSLVSISLDSGDEYQVHDSNDVIFSEIEKQDTFYFYSQGGIFKYNTSSNEKTFIGELHTGNFASQGLSSYQALDNPFWYNDQLFFNANEKLHVYRHQDLNTIELTEHKLFPGILEGQNYTTLSIFEDKLYLFQINLESLAFSTTLLDERKAEYLARSDNYIFAKRENLDGSQSIFYLDKTDLQLNNIPELFEIHARIEGSGSNIIIIKSIDSALQFINGQTLEILDLSSYVNNNEFYTDDLLFISRKFGHFFIGTSTVSGQNNLIIYKTGSVYESPCAVNVNANSSTIILFESCNDQLIQISDTGFQVIQLFPEHGSQDHWSTTPPLDEDYTLLYSQISNNESALISLVPLSAPQTEISYEINQKLYLYNYRFVGNRLVILFRDIEDTSGPYFKYKIMTFSLPNMELIHELEINDHRFLPWVDPDDYGVLSDRLLFRLGSEELGTELWEYNWNLNEVNLVADINPGEADSSPGDFLSSSDGKINLFLARNSSDHRELFLVDAATKSEEVSQIDNSITVFPNPVSSTLFLNQSSRDVNIFDISGNLVFTKRSLRNGLEIDVSAFKNGIYILSGITELGEAFTKQFIVLR